MKGLFNLSCVGVIFQMPDQAAPKLADIGLDFPDVLPERVQLGDEDLISPRLSVAVVPGD